ncbi:unnamed protein product, partial [marine sediment metagenome]
TDRSPVLALVGQIPEVYLGSEAFQEISQIALFRPFAEYAETVARSNQAIKLTMMAVKYALKKPGLSVLSCPTDILADKLDDSIIEPDKRIFGSESVSDEKDIQKAADLINKCNRPVIFGGWGSRFSGDLLMEMSKKLKAPIATNCSIIFSATLVSILSSSFFVPSVTNADLGAPQTGQFQESDRSEKSLPSFFSS